MTAMTENRGAWGSKIGFIFAAASSAAGLDYNGGSYSTFHTQENFF